MSKFSESKIVYREGNQIRAIRGRVSIDRDFYVVHRRDGIVKIAKTAIIKVEEYGGG